MSALAELGVVEAAAAVQTRTASSVELVQALLDRIAATDARIQAWETVDADGALAQARRCDDAALRGHGGPLNGVPVGVKDIYHVAGLPTRAGCPALYDRIPRDDAEAVRRLRLAGAVILGKTVTTAFATVDPPRTRNPWNLERTPGGSSSGSAAAVAARQVPAALGTQTAGSVLRPAAYCGAVGVKPTFGRISRRGVIPLAWSLDHVGFIVRGVADAAALLTALAGHDPADPGSRDRPTENYLAAVANPAPPRLAVVEDVLERAEPAVRAHTEQVVMRLLRAGAAVQFVRLPESFERLLAVHQVILQVETAAVHARLHAERADDYPPRLRATVEVGKLIPGEAYLRAQRLRARLRAEMRALFERADCLVMPTASNAAPDPSTTGDVRFQAIWSLLGWPALSLPSGLSAERLPLGLQLVAAPWAESTLLGAASWCEQQLGRLPGPP
ncbi:MAG: amidase [Chloroflexi bacterium]|nr:amidase [Chloroflexota bacterium]